MKKKKGFLLTEEMKLEWKQNTIDYLKTLHNKPLHDLESALMTPGFLKPKFKLKGTFLLERGSTINEAWYLRNGLAILYVVQPKTDDHNICYIWERDTIIVLHKAFMENLPSKDYYIELVEDCELVGISNLTMGGIYEEHTVAHILTQNILNLQMERRMSQLEILMMPKIIRLGTFEEMFPGLRGRLSNEEICSFIGIKSSTLGSAKGSR